MRNEIQKMESNVSLRDHMICYLYQSGDPCLVQQAKQLAVQSSKSHVLHIMKANFSCFIPEHKEDLYQCGMVGVLKALVHYNGTRPFHAYSKNYVIHEMSEYTYYLRNIPSAYFARLERKISSTADTLKANGCLLCAEAIAMSSGINIEIVQRELAVMARKQLVYLDSIAGISFLICFSSIKIFLLHKMNVEWDSFFAEISGKFIVENPCMKIRCFFLLLTYYSQTERDNRVNNPCCNWKCCFFSFITYYFQTEGYYSA